jgi:hypothetical protein
VSFRSIEVYQINSTRHRTTLSGRFIVVMASAHLLIWAIHNKGYQRPENGDKDKSHRTEYYASD